mmetsp:Transcript_50639/g.108455  ORF Transcript_50639/g.108455 Transcript_50639/m.108455 type:complete len:241 (+) Transcript_50639:32-754(+)
MVLAPSAIIATIVSSHIRRETMCFFSSPMILLGSSPGRTASAPALIHTVMLGGLIFEAMLSNIPSTFSKAGFIKGPWKAPCLPMIVVICAPHLLATTSSSVIAASKPPTEKPSGNMLQAIWQLPCFEAQSLQSLVSLLSSKPMTESMPWTAPEVAQVWTASPLACTNFRPSSKDQTPAAVSAAYSPTEKPAQDTALSRISGFSTLSFSKAHMSATYTRGCTMRWSPTQKRLPPWRSSMTS